MGKSNTLQSSFASGEVSPLLRGRVDVARYLSGVETCENMVVRPQGPVWKRSGTTHVSRMNRFGFRSIGPARIQPFIFSSTEAYLIEFSDSYILIRDNNGVPVLTGAAASIYSVVNNAGLAEVNTVAPHGFSTNDSVLVTLSTVATYNVLAQITVTSVTSFILNGEGYNGTATASVSKCVQLVSPYSLVYARELSFAQSADTMWICHKYYKPRTLTRTSATSWSIQEYTTVDGPYLDYDRTDTRMTISGITDSATLDGNAAFVAGSPFIVADVGSYIEFMDNNEWLLAKITAKVSTSEATVDIVDNLKLGIDPIVQLSAKASDSTRQISRTPTLSNRYGNTPAVRQGGYTNPLYRPHAAVPGISPSKVPPKMIPDGVDPAATLIFTGAPNIITSSHSGTFDISDVGKVVRVTNVAYGAAASWYTISSWPTTTTANYIVPVAVIAPIKAYAYTGGGERVTLRQNSRTISATLTASVATFAATDVGRHVRLSYNNRWVFCRITAYTSTTVVTVALYDSFPRHLRDATHMANDGNTDVWRFGAWYGSDGSGNYPSQVTFHEQRLVFAGSPAEPQAIWFSRPQDFDKMSPSEADGTVTDDSAINVTLASNRANAITWLQSMKVLLVGTIGGEWQGRAATSIMEPITPTNIAFTEETTHGSINSSQPVKVGSAALFLQRSGQKLRELTYRFETDGWDSRDLTVASEHILRKGTKGIKVAFQNEPHSVVWVLTSTGEIAALTYQREQEVIGWHYHRMGGSGTVDDIAVLPSSSGLEDRVFLVVRRTIDGADMTLLEKVNSDHYPVSATDKNGFCYVDCGASQTMTGTGTTWSGLSHLVGQSVTVLKNGVKQGTFTPNSAGVITGLSYVLNDVLTGGYSYTAKLKSLPVQGGSPYGSSDMTKKRVARLFMRIFNSINAYVGRDESHLQLRTFGTGAVGAELIYTGDVDLVTNLEYSSDGVFHIQSSDPYPLILLSTVAQVVANE